MDLQLPVIWSLYGTTTPGRVEVSPNRLTFTSRGRAFALPLASIAEFVIERGPSRRLRGLPVLSLSLVGGDIVGVASMGGAGSLQDLTALVAGRQMVASGT